MDNIQFVRLQMLKEERSGYYTGPINTPDMAAKILINYIGSEDREHFVVLCLDSRNKVNAIHTVHIGTLNESMVHPREVFKVAILSNAHSIVVGHNHPSGEVSASPEDVGVTDRLVKAGKLMRIEVLDHIIVSDGNYCSLKQEGKWPEDDM